jgi:hypothetical protein
VLTALLIAVPALLVVGGPARADFRPTDGLVTYIKFPAIANRCLDVRDRRIDKGTPMQLWDCGPEWNQQFVFTEPGYQTGRLSWKIRPRYLTPPWREPAKCLDAKEGLHAITPVQIWECHDGWQQRWVVDGVGSNSFKLRAAYDLNYCLDIPYPDNGSPAYIAPCADNSPGQLLASS